MERLVVVAHRQADDDDVFGDEGGRAVVDESLGGGGGVHVGLLDLVCRTPCPTSTTLGLRSPKYKIPR